MKKILFSLVLFFCSISFVFAYSEDEVSFLEMKKYGQTYNNQSLADRLFRLETDILGMRQSGDLDSRINTLNNIFSNPAPNAIVPPSVDIYSSRRKGLLGRFLDDFSSGYVTGFIPPINTGYYSDDYHNNYCPYGNNQVHSTYHYRGYHPHHRHLHSRPYNPYGDYNYRPTYFNRNVSTGSAIHILQD